MANFRLPRTLAWLFSAALLPAACDSSPQESTSTQTASTTGGGGAGAGSTSSNTAGGGAGGTGGTPIDPPPFDWIGMVGTGQSLSVGAAAVPLVSTAQPYHNLKLVDSSAPPSYDGVGDMLSVMPLVAPLRPLNQGLPTVAYPDNIFGETPNEGLGNQVAASTLAATGSDWVTVQTNVGESGQGISVIEKDGTGKAYAATLYEVKALTDLAAQAGKTYGVGGIFLTHGETDALNSLYAERVSKLQLDYEADIPAITGQMEPVPLFISQQSTFPPEIGPTYSLSTLAAWQLGAFKPDSIYCAGPKYQYEYAGDKVHLTGPSSRRLGEKYGQVYHQVKVVKQGWRPLEPVSAKLTGNTITVDFLVPVPPLAWEETQPPSHQTTFPQWAAGRGFEVLDSTGALVISSVEIKDSSVVITLAAAPAGQDLTVAYALFQDEQGFHGGDAVGRHGQLRDSDAFIGYSARSIDVTATQGSPVVTAVTAGDFADRGRTELASGAGLSKGAVVQQIAGDSMTLSAPWEGASGNVKLDLRNDHRNYAVQFLMAVVPGP